MQPLHCFDLNQKTLDDGEFTTKLSEAETRSPRLRKIELWSGRLAMFGLTTMLATIAIHAA